jgi:hypothetical protein
MANIKPQFLPLTPQEIFELTEKIRTQKPFMTGLNLARQPFRIKASSLENNNVITAKMQKSSDLDAIFEEVTFNFNLNNNKYFFQGLIKPANLAALEVSIELSTEIHAVHRRAQERLIIPPDFYGVLKINNINSKPGKIFSRILNISSSGCSIEFKTENELKAKDVILAELTFPTRLPIDIECEVVHRRESRDTEGKVVLIFGLRYLIKKPQEDIIMKDLMIDLFRDIFVISKKVS